MDAKHRQPGPSKLKGEKGGKKPDERREKALTIVLVDISTVQRVQLDERGL
jgi:hypothetical protein